MPNNLISGPILACLAQIWAPNFCLWVLLLLDVRHCLKQSLHTTSSKTYDPNSIKWQKTHFGANLVQLRPNSGRQFFFFKNLASLVTRYHGQPPPCRNQKKTSANPNLEKIY